MKRLAIVLSLFAATAAFGQTPTLTPATPRVAGPIPPPMPPIMTQYRFWPEQLVQWIGTELPYTMAMLEFDDNGGRPVFDFALEERATGKRIHYSNLQGVVDAAKSQNLEAWLDKGMKLDRPDATTPGATFTFHMTLHDGKPVEWRFIQGSDIMEQGGGLSAFPDTPVPVLAYREQAAVAGEGTAIQIGDIASVAEPWKEVSHPPYFMAWHGAYSLNATTLVLNAGEEKWTIASAPPALAAGATWKLTSASGREETIHADKVDGDHATLSITIAPGYNQRAVDAIWDGTSWHYNSLRYTPRQGEKVATTLQFSPALSSDGTSNFDVLIGKKKIVTASATADATKKYTIAFKSPEWLKPKSLTESLTATRPELPFIPPPINTTEEPNSAGCPIFAATSSRLRWASLEERPPSFPSRTSAPKQRNNTVPHSSRRYRDEWAGHSYQPIESCI